VDRLVATGALLMAGRAGLLLRYLLAGIAFVLVARLLRRLQPDARAWGQVAAGIVLLALLTTVPLAALLVLHAALLFWVVEHAPSGVRAPAAVVVVALHAVLPLVVLPWLPGYAAKGRELIVFATNLALLRAWAYASDRLARPNDPSPSLRDYAHYMSFFPAFVNGPFLALDDFGRRRLAAYWDDGAFDWIGVRRVLVGLVAVAGALALAPVLEPSAYEAAAHGGALRAWSHALGIYFAVYLGFTAWTEIEIGLARLAGIALPENFANPTLAYGPADFWRRWNITLGHWLRAYVYLPLGGAMPRRRTGARAPEWRNTAAVFAVMVAYHVLGGMKLLGATSLPALAYFPWLVWGAINTIGVLATRSLTRPSPNPLVRATVVALTVAFAAAGHMTAFFPPTLSLVDLLGIWRRLLFLG
jgi:D-alanyl-lipoteichoic acid acyltransferase DltB (MBOAT superfamily)